MFVPGSVMVSNSHALLHRDPEVEYSPAVAEGGWALTTEGAWLEDEQNQQSPLSSLQCWSAYGEDLKLLEIQGQMILSPALSM